MVSPQHLLILLNAGVGLIVVPISSGVACAPSLGNKALIEKIIKNLICTKNNMKRIHKLISFDKFCRKLIQDILKDKNEHEALCNVFNKYVDEKKVESSLL